LIFLDILKTKKTLIRQGGDRNKTPIQNVRRGAVLHAASRLAHYLLAADAPSASAAAAAPAHKVLTTATRDSLAAQAERLGESELAARAKKINTQGTPPPRRLDGR
jgi:hypothetical protein